MNKTVDELYALLRQYFYAFIPKCFEAVNPGQVLLENWHLESIAWHLEQCAKGKITRLIIEGGPSRDPGGTPAFSIYYEHTNSRYAHIYC